MSGGTPTASRAGRVAFVLKGYPRLSETFIAQEIEALEARGLEILIVSLRQPTDRTVHPVHESIRAARLYLPEYLYQEPLRVWRGWRRSRRHPGYRSAFRVWLADLRRDLTPNRVRRFGQALVLAAELPAEIRHLHAHFLHTPASVARYAAMMLGIDWTVSAHAKDIWTTAEWEKREKLADASWAVTCTEAGHNHLAELAPTPGTVALCYHGLALDRFPPPSRETTDADGSDPARPVVLLSVGRLVEKKGYDDLLAALGRLPAGLFWRLVHVGGGPFAGRLNQQAERLGLAGRVEWRGARPQPDVLAAYREADLFVLAAKTAKDGDRDGLPNVLLEAQSQRLACVATRLSGIPELIEHERSGLLVPPGDPDSLATAIAALIRDPERRAQFGAAGMARVQRDFNMAGGIDFLAAQFGLAPSPPAALPKTPSEDAAPAAESIAPAEGVVEPTAEMDAPVAELIALAAVPARPRRMGAALALRSQRMRQG